ncbi:hypothetical protein [Aquirufa aurantiipilula]|uniref:Uncharacterized protein n=1 Tax=Aquirufa aurantiipilula TaxID=2696561 RepID=A0ABT6BKS6_9BACT|nr:hypothetical protein [Aquirufa aurantiipilula]MDF5691017.1 hypothetical protein [Aquirufa aurantiipilula]
MKIDTHEHHEFDCKNSNPIQDKKTWISPDITIWNAENIENSGGKGGDGSGQAYVT